MRHNAGPIFVLCSMYVDASTSIVCCWWGSLASSPELIYTGQGTNRHVTACSERTCTMHGEEAERIPWVHL